MSELVCVLWLIALLILVVSICLLAVAGLGTLIGLVDGHYLAQLFGFTWRLWAWWMASTFIGLGISLYNSGRYTNKSHG